MEIKIKIDYRETELLQLIKNSDTKFIWESCNLLIGDVVLYKRAPVDNNTLVDNTLVDSEWTPFLWIERKTFADLRASIRDGRFREQKERLIKTTSVANNILFILEGPKKGDLKIPVSTINSAIQNLIFKHEFLVMCTSDTQDTLNSLLMLAKKFNESEFIKESPKNVISIKKSDNIPVFIRMLTGIQGVSENIATKIHEKYNCISDLIKAFSTIDSPDILLASIQISKSRKLGKVLSKKIYSGLFS